jgi:hypothetical protein
MRLDRWLMVRDHQWIHPHEIGWSLSLACAR